MSQDNKVQSIDLSPMSLRSNSFTRFFSTQRRPSRSSAWVRHLSTVRVAQHQFIAILFLTIFIVCTLDFFWQNTHQNIPRRPRIIRQTFLYTAEVEDQRRLGNAMFALASLIGIAHQNNATPVIPKRIRLTDIFQLAIPQSIDMLNTMGGHCVPYEEYGRRGGAYDISMLRLHKLKTNIKLMGYLQSFKYFESMDESVRQNFRFNAEIQSQVRTFFNEELSGGIPPDWIPGGDADRDYVRVGIHIRRGDILDDYMRNYGYVTASAEYISKAMRYFLTRYKRVVFIVCSDDLVWSRANLPHDSHVIVYSEKKAAEVDLAILSSCDHVIVTVGSFGWWAAWLANGTTIYYDKWPRPVSQLEYQVEKRDYFPPHWIPLS